MKRLLSLNLILVMLLGMLPATAMAAESTQVGESSYTEYITIDGTQYDAASEDRISGDGWTYQSGILTLTGYRGGAIETNVELSVFYDGANTVTAQSGHGISATSELTLRPVTNGEEESALAVYAAEGYHAVCVEGTAEIWPSALTLVGGGTSAVSATRIKYGSYWPHTLKVGDDAESAVEGEYTTQNYYAIELIPCFMTLYGNGGTTESGKESYRFQVDFTTGTSADMDLYDKADVFANGEKSQVGWGVNAEGTGTTYSCSNSYSYANGVYDASLYALWDDTHAEICRIWENSYGTTTWTSKRYNVVEIGGKYTLPDIVRDGYTLDGWRGDDGVLYAANTSVVVTKSATYTAEYTPVDATVSKLMFRQATWDSANSVYYEDETKALSTGWDASIESGNLVQFYFGTEENCVKVGMDELTTSDGVYLYEQDGFVWIRGSDFGAQEIIYTDAEGVEYTMPVNIGLPPVSFYSQPEASEKAYIGQYASVYVSGENNVFYVAAATGYSVFAVALNENLDAIADVEVAKDGSYAKITVTESFADGRFGMSITYGTDKWNSTMTRNLMLYNYNPKLMLRHMAWDSENKCYYENEDYDLQSSWYNSINAASVVKFYYGTKDQYAAVSLDELSTDGDIKLSAYEGGFILMEPAAFGEHEVHYTAPDGVKHALPATVTLPTLGFYSAPEATEKSYLYQKFTLSGEDNAFYLIPLNCALNKVNLRGQLAEIAEVEIAEDGSYAKITVNGAASGDWYSLEAEMTSDGWSWTEYADLRISDGNPHLAFRGMSWGENGWYENPNEAMYGNLNLHITSGRPVKFYFVTEEDCVAVSLDELTVSGSGVELRSEEDHIRIIAEQFGTWYIGYTAADGEEYRLPVTVGVPTYAFYSTPIASVDNYITEFGVTDENNTFYMVSSRFAITGVDLEPELAKIATVEVAEDGSYAAITVTGTPEGRVYSAQAHAEDANGNSFSGQWGLRIYDNTTHLMYRSMSWDEENQCHYEDPDQPMHSSWEISIGSGAPVRFYFGTEDSYVYVPAEELTVSAGLYLSPDVNFVHVGAEAFGWQEITYAADDGILHILPVTVGLPELGFYKDKTASVENFLYDSFVVTAANNTFYLVSTTNTITDVTLNPSLAKIATVEVAEDGSYATITVTGSPGGYWYSMLIGLKNGNWTGSRNRGLNLIDGNPHLMFRQADWTPDTGWFDNPDMGMMTNWGSEINSSMLGRFFFGTEKSYVPVSLKQLSVSGDGIELGGSDEMAWLACMNEGVYYVTYTADDGAEHTFRVVVYLPALGFYTEPKASGEYYTSVYTVTKANEVLYLVPSDGTLTKLALGESLAKIAEAELAADGSYAAITITGTPEGSWYDVTATYETVKGSWTETVNVRLDNGIVEVPEEPDVIVEIVDEGQCGDELYWTLAVETDVEGNSQVVLSFTGSGEMYNYDTSDPDWFPFNDEIQEIRLSEKQTSIGAFAFGFMDGIYSITIPASVKSIGTCAFAQCVNLHEVIFEGGAPAIAENAFSNVTAACLYPENNATWTTVVRANYGGTLDWVAYDAGTGDGDDSDKPHLMYYQVGMGEDDSWVDLGYGMEDAWYFHGTYLCNQVVFCFGTKDSWVPVDFNQLWVTDSEAVELTDRGYTVEGHSVVDVAVFAFGDYSICYKDTDGTEYSMPVNVYLPDVGYFSTPVFSEDTYLGQFDLTASNRTVYLVSNVGDIVIDSVEMDEDFVDCTEWTVKGNYVAITFTKDPDPWCDYMYLKFTVDCGEDGYSERGNGLLIGLGESGGDVEEPEVPEISASGTCGMYGDNLIWTLENGVLTISGSGEMMDCSGYTAPWSAYYSNIKEVVVEEGVTTIGPWAFAYCEQMTKVTLPSSLMIIDYGAFVLCTALTEVTIPSAVTLINSQAFTNCTALSKVTFLGNAPKFNEDMYPGLDSFANVVADCYYPADNTTWTADVMLNYAGDGGLLTWIPYTGDIEEPDVPESGQLMFYHVGENAEGKWDDMGWGMKDGWYSDGFGGSCVVFCFGTEDKWTPVNLSNLWVSDSEAVVLAIRGETVEGYSAISMDVFAFGEFSVCYETADGTVYSMPVHVYPPDVGFYSQPVISGEYYINQFNVTETNRTFYLVSDRGDITQVELNDGFADCTEVTVNGNYVTITFTEIPDFTQKQLFVDVYIDKTGTGVGEWSAGRGLQIVVDETGGDVEETEVTVTFDLNTDDENVWGDLAPATIKSGETVKLPVRAEDFDRAYYVFKGWFTKPEGGEQVTDETPITDDCTLYAQWEERTTITLILYVSEITGTDPETGENVGDWVEPGTYTVTVTAPDGTAVPAEAGTGVHEGGLLFRDLVAADAYTLTITRDGYKPYVITTQDDPYGAGIGLAEMGLHSGGVIFSTAGIWEPDSGDEPEQPEIEYAVSNLHLEASDGEVYLCWDAPKTAPEGEVWYVACFSYDGGETWEYGIGAGGRDDTGVSLTGMPLAWYHNEVVTTAFKVVTEVDGVQVAECAADLTLSVGDKKLPAANVTVTAPETEGGKYTITVTGLTPNTYIWLIGQSSDGGSMSHSYSDMNGTCTFAWNSTRMDAYLADATSVYLVRELIGASAVEDGLSATYTIGNRGGWASLADAVNGGTDVPEEPENGYAVTDLRFDYLGNGGLPFLYWTAPAGVEGDLNYNVHVSTDGGKTWTMLSSTSQDLIDLTGLDAAVYNAFKVETKLDGKVLAECSAKLTLTVTQGKDLPAATVVVTAPESEGGDYDFTVSGLTPGAWVTFTLKHTGGHTASGSNADSSGMYYDRESYDNMSRYLADSTSAYMVKEFSDGYIAEDGLSAAYTVSNRGDWVSLADAVNGGGTGEPDEPEENVLTRAGVCVAIVDAMGWEYEESMAVSFDDLSEDHEAYKAIAVLTYKGIIAGSEGKFNPDGVLSREQLAVILCKVLEEESVVDEKIRPADVPATRWSAGWICTALNQGLMTTDANNNFRPADPALVTDTDFSKLPEIGGEPENVGSGVCGDDLTWELKSRVDENGENCYELIITGTGAMYEFSYKNLPGWWDYKEQIKWIELPEGLTSVGAHAFENCYYVTELTIPDSVESLGDDAFVYMSYLEQLTLGSGLKTIGRAAFYGCDKSLKEVVIPDSVTYIGVSAFAGCDVLEKVTLGSGLITIGDYAFQYDACLTEIAIPDSVTAIGYQAFEQCFALEKVTFGSGVTEIEGYAFSSTALTEVIIPEGVTVINEGTFAGCDFTEVTIPTGVTKINSSAFGYCYDLVSVTFEGPAPSFISSNAFANVTAKCRYPAAKAGWTTEMLANYGGNLTWEPYGYEDATQTVGTVYLDKQYDNLLLRWKAPGKPRDDLYYRITITDANGVDWGWVETAETYMDITHLDLGSYTVRVASCFGEAGLEAAVKETTLKVVESASKYPAKVMIREDETNVYFSGLNSDRIHLYETDTGEQHRVVSDKNGFGKLIGWHYPSHAGINYRVREISLESATDGTLLVLYTTLGWTEKGAGWYCVDDALPKAASPDSIVAEGFEHLTEAESEALLDAAAGITVELVADQVTDFESGAEGETVEVEIVLDVTVLAYETPIVDDGSAIIGGSRALVLDIEPMAVVTTTDGDGVSSSTTHGVDTTGVYVTVNIPLPAGFANVGEQLYVIHTKDNGERTIHPVAVMSDEYGNLYVSFMNSNGFSAFNVTSGFASVTDGLGNETLYDDLNKALKAAGTLENGKVTMLSDQTVDGVVIPSGVTLDLADTTLTASYVVGLNGSYLTANPNSGKLVVKKGSLILAEEGYKNGVGEEHKVQYILPIWDPSQNCYLFSLFVANTEPEKSRGLVIDEVNEEIYFQFKHQATGAINKGLLADNGARDHALKVIVRLSWSNDQGEAYQDFVYNDNQVKLVTGTNDYNFRLTGYSTLNIDIETLTVTAMIVSDSGATAFGTEWTLENAK